MKKTSIKHKVSSLTVSVSIISVIIVGMITVVGILLLRDNMSKVSSQLGDTAAADSQTTLEDRMIERLETLVKNKASLSDKIMREVQNSTEMIAYYATEIVQNPDKYKRNPVTAPRVGDKGVMTAQFLKAQGVDLSEISDESDVMGNIENLLLNIIENNIDATTDYIGSEKGYVILVDDAPEKKAEFFDPRERPWYKLAKKNNELSWTDTYLDSYGRGLAITCAKPYYHTGGSLAGVAGVGMVLTDIAESVTGAKVGDTGRAFMLNEHGQIIISEMGTTDEEGNMIRHDLLNSGNSELAALALNMISRKEGIERVTMDGKEYFIAYAALETVPWSLATVIEVDEAIAPALQLREEIIGMKNVALSDINLIIVIIIALFIVVFVPIVLIISYVSRKFSSALTNPITVLQNGVREIADGNLEHSIDIHTGDEIEDLGLSVNKMALDIKEHIHNLAVQTQEKERIASDLRIATGIQADMLPKIFPPFSDRDDLHMSSFMLPAKEVGGDFYDFFFLDDEQKRIALVIADVSGKGVPAALFMVIAKVLIKNNKDLPCDEILNTVNNLLASDNNSSMFVTTFFSVLNLETGEYDYTSAGHNPPLLYRKESGEYTFLEMPKTPPLAIFPDKKFSSRSIMLQKGDVLLMYTDGVTEAFNTQSIMYGSERLAENLRRLIDKSVDEIVSEMYASIKEFAAGEPQSDDITMLCCRYFGRL